MNARSTQSAKDSIRITSIVGSLVALAMLVLAIAYSGSNGPSTAVVAVVGLAAAQTLSDLLKNLAAGIVVKGTQPFDVGETIEVEDYSGIVAHIGFRVVTILRSDGRVSQIPNAGLLTSVITTGEVNGTQTSPGNGLEAPNDSRFFQELYRRSSFHALHNLMPKISSFHPFSEKS